MAGGGRYFFCAAAVFLALAIADEWLAFSSSLSLWLRIIIGVYGGSWLLGAGCLLLGAHLQPKSDSTVVGSAYNLRLNYDN